jgi:alkaline phosphatase
MSNTPWPLRSLDRVFSRCAWQRVRQMCTLVATLVLANCATAKVSGDPDAGGGVDGGDDVTPWADAQIGPDAPQTSERRIVIVMIGDGMGPGQLAAAGHYASGSAGSLFLETLPAKGQLLTASLSGITDSAAAATTMATGYATTNGAIGVDRRGQPRETLVEAAHRLGLSAGVVTTSSLPHATPGAFTAHHPSRHDYVDIADDQALEVQPDVMFGGGWQFFAPAGDDSVRDDAGLIAPLQAAGYQIVRTGAELAAIAPTPDARVVGLFAPEHLTYVVDRAPDTTEPTLTDMTLRALAQLDTDPDGFFLMIEGARIDMASHGNDTLRAITETVAFDDTVRAVSEWASGRTDVTLIVTADHECGGLEVITPYGPGQVPDVAWRWGNHTNARIDVHGSGPGTEVLDGELRDHAWVHAVASAALEGTAVVAPTGGLRPDGRLDDLRFVAATQTVASGFGAGFNQLDALRLDADEYGLSIGIEGVFEWDANAVVVLIDTDLGGGTGLATLSGVLGDSAGRVDSIASSLQVRAPTGVPFGADFALVVWGGSDPHVEDLSDDAGLRAFVAPLGNPTDLGWYGAAVNFDDGVRARGAALPTRASSGLEAHVPWHTLYPALGSGVPPGAELGITVILVNDDGGYTSNQALPPFPAGAANPGRTPTSLPGIVRLRVDGNSDGTAGDVMAPTTAP